MFKEIKYFIQRGKRGWADCDVWDFQCYLSDIIINGIKKLQKEHMGCPSELWDKARINDECHRWREVLEEIAQGFEATKELNNSYGCKYKKDLKDGAFTYEYDKEKAELLTKKYEKGMKLFGQYFPLLWD